jgi:hypothetical protein
LLPVSRNHHISVYCSISGWKAVEYAEFWEPGKGWFMDPVLTGIGTYKTREEAEIEARDWAASEGVPFKS